MNTVSHLNIDICKLICQTQQNLIPIKLGSRNLDYFSKN